MLFLDSLAIAAATYALLRVWYQTPSLARARELARAEAHQGDFMSRLMSCPVCLCFWVSTSLCLIFLVPLAIDPSRALLRFLLYLLAIPAIVPLKEFFEDGDGPSESDRGADDQHPRDAQPPVGGA